MFIISRLEGAAVSDREAKLAMNAAEEYFNSVYEQTYPKLLRRVTARLSGEGAYHDICDVLQDTYSEFYKAIKRNGTEYAQSSIALLYTIADTRLARTYEQKRSHVDIVSLSVQTEPDDEDLFIADFEATPELAEEDRVINKTLAEQIMAVVRSGDERDYKIFSLRYEHDMKLEDIAAALSLKPHIVKNRLYRKLAELKKLFNGEV